MPTSFMPDSPYRRGLLQAVAGAAALGVLPFAAAQTRRSTWPAWDVFKTQFINPDGRVISDDGDGTQTYSEGQAYALFFALVANDRPAFSKLLQWTENNLSGGDLTARLPAWQWGKRPDNTWGVLDPNAASDSDLWIAYALGEAGRLWKDEGLRARSTLLADRILREATADIPRLGLTLLPAPQGFVLSPQRWRLNPSYTPLHLMQWMATYQTDPRWQALLASSTQVLHGSSPKGFTPDWAIYDASQGFLVDTEGKEKGQGAYNAIRVYLWAGLMHSAAPERKALLTTLTPMARYIRENGHPPESIDILTGVATQPGPPGFSAAMLPFLRATGEKQALQSQRQRLLAQPVRVGAYYEQTLALFGGGALAGQFQFTPSGRLQPRWK